MDFYNSEHVVHPHTSTHPIHQEHCNTDNTLNETNSIVKTIDTDENNIGKNDVKPQKKKKRKKNRCSNCNKAIGFLKLNCECSDKIFCSSCILPEVHMCTINYKEKRESLKKKLVKVQNNKVPPI
jgi:hypothetical protein